MSQTRSAYNHGWRSPVVSVLQLRHILRQLHQPVTVGEKPEGLIQRFTDILFTTWDLGFTAFGGPPVHFQILHKRFVEKYKWLDEQTYQELFAICQSLPGPGSTKMGFSIALNHSGFIPALMYFAIWSLPGAVGIFLLARGVSRVTTTLPPAVYTLLSGSNAATVGIIAVAAIQLSQNAITDGMTRSIVILGACAGLVYNALWCFPILIILGGFLCFIWDFGARKLLFTFKTRITRAFATSSHPHSGGGPQEDMEMSTIGPDTTGTRPDVASTLNERRIPTQPTEIAAVHDIEPAIQSNSPTNEVQPPVHQISTSPITLRTGVLLIVGFLVSFVAIVVARAVLHNPPVAFKLFSNMYLAGTIIFGGGPVVIPLLREYIVTEGWVSTRDFLIGLAVIQAFPGPNFNFAVYLAALTSSSANSPAIVTALLGFIGIFFPGNILVVGFSPVWHYLRRYRAVKSVLRGLNAVGVGLVWTAVYRLWEIGYLKVDATNGVSLGLEPWWVVVAVISFSSNRWFNWPAAVSILLGATMGIAWWAAVGR